METKIKSVVIESMTIPFVISIAGSDEAVLQAQLQKLMQPVKLELERINQRYSTYLADSLVSNFRNGQDELLNQDAEFKSFYEACLKAQRDTNGYFNPFDDAKRFEPLGYVKGWAIEMIFQKLIRPCLDLPTVSGVCFNGGGDLQFASSGDFKWNIGIEDPTDLTELVASYQLANGGMATSGYSKRGHHIRINGVADLLQVTVFADSLTRSDVWATAGLAAGAAAFRELIRKHRLTGCFLDQAHHLSYFNGGEIIDVKQ